MSQKIANLEIAKASTDQRERVCISAPISPSKQHEPANGSLASSSSIERMIEAEM